MNLVYLFYPEFLIECWSRITNPPATNSTAIYRLYRKLLVMLSSHSLVRSPSAAFYLCFIFILLPTYIFNPFSFHCYTTYLYIDVLTAILNYFLEHLNMHECSNYGFEDIIWLKVQVLRLLFKISTAYIWSKRISFSFLLELKFVFFRC